MTTTTRPDSAGRARDLLAELAALLGTQSGPVPDAVVIRTTPASIVVFRDNVPIDALDLNTSSPTFGQWASRIADLAALDGLSH